MVGASARPDREPGLNLYLHGVHIGTLAFDGGVYTFRYAETYEGPALLGFSHREREYQSKVLCPLSISHSFSQTS